MSEKTILSSYLEALMVERNRLDNVDIEALVDEKVAEIKADIRQKVVLENENAKHDADVSIRTIKSALEVIAQTLEVSESEEEVSEVISDETY